MPILLTIPKNECEKCVPKGVYIFIFLCYNKIIIIIAKKSKHYVSACILIVNI